jgi:hypothetical protein
MNREPFTLEKLSETIPGYWMDETTGILRPAVEAYLTRAEMTTEQIAALRAYLRQWVNSSVWDQNPHAGTQAKLWLSRLRTSIGNLTTRETISDWIDDAIALGMEPL